MKHADHIIQQQNIEINFENFSDGIGIQNEISDLFHEKLFPKMEMLFDEIAGEKYLLSVENMEIDCGLLSAKNWKEELIHHALSQLKIKLTVAKKKEIKESQVEQKRLMDSFLFFLDHGRLPWNSAVLSVKELEDIRIDTIFLRELRELIQLKPKAAERFVYSFSEIFFDKIAKSLSETMQENISDIYFLIHEKMDTENKDDIKSLLLKMLSDQRRNKKEILDSMADTEEMTQQIKPGKEDENVLEENKAGEQTIKNKEDNQRKTKNDKKDKSNKIKAESEIEEVYIRNAGLVILHPFLEVLFSRIGFMKEKKWVDNISQHTAARVLEYLGSGNEELPEFESCLNKIMCGIPVDDVLMLSEKLSDEIKSECGELHAEVIKHWSKLKNTSIAALRETFLQRNGKLTEVENGWLLNVEQKGFDILLESLPWGIGTIKLPWAENKLHVEWI